MNSRGRMDRDPGIVSLLAINLNTGKVTRSTERIITSLTLNKAMLCLLEENTSVKRIGQH